MKALVRRLAYYFLGLIIVGIPLLMIFNFVIMPMIVRKGETTKVPNVLGRTLEEAVRLLKEHELTPVVDTLIPSYLPKNTVVEQDPLPGYTVKKGRKVFLVISTGLRMVRIPDVLQKPLYEAEEILRSLGLDPIVEYVETEEIESDVVMDVVPDVGDSVPVGSRVKLYVSKEVL